MKVVQRSAGKALNDLILRRIDLLKIDAEGSEHRILTSILSHKSLRHPRAIVVEANGEMIERVEIVHDLREAGYQVFGIERSYFLLRCTPVSANTNTADYSRWHDLIAIHTTAEELLHRLRLV